MKKRSYLFTTVLGALAFVSSLSAQTQPDRQLLVGWHSFGTDRNSPDAPSESASGFTGTLVGGAGNGRTAGNNIVGGNTYGGSSFTFTPVPGSLGIGTSTFSNPNRRIDFTITNNSGMRVSIDEVYFDIQSSFGTGFTYFLAHLSPQSDLEDSFDNRELIRQTLPDGTFGTPVQLSVATSDMVDVMLADGETAAFRIQLFPDPMLPPPVNFGGRIDNIGIGGTPIPEPGTYALLAGVFVLPAVMLRRG